jgi:type III secretion system FlhB-like substrate exporter
MPMKTPLEAVALEYGHLNTPKVVAKGQSELALRIINEAKKQGIYVAEDPQLLACSASWMWAMKSRKTCTPRWR